MREGVNQHHDRTLADLASLWQRAGAMTARTENMTKLDWRKAKLHSRVTFIPRKVSRAPDQGCLKIRGGLKDDRAFIDQWLDDNPELLEMSQRKGTRFIREKLPRWCQGLAMSRLRGRRRRKHQPSETAAGS